MQKVLRGMVNDHRLPCDYNHHFNQPWHSRAFLRNLKRWFVNRIMTKQNVSVPAFILFVCTPTWVTYYMFMNYYLTGQVNQAFQNNGQLYRKGNCGYQMQLNMNPDNFWNSCYQCWVTDPHCGLDLAPKRPWLDLKDP